MTSHHPSPPELHRLQRNLPLLYALNGAQMFLVILPVIVPYFQSLGLDMGQVYLLQAIFAGAVLLMEFPSGYLSDLLGRKRTLQLAGVMNGIGYTLFALSSGFFSLAAAQVFLAIGISLFSGTDIALLYDTLDELRSRQEGEKKSTNQPSSARFIGQKIYYQQMGETIAGLVGGWLVLISLSTPAYAQAILSWLPLLMSFALVEPPRQRMSSTHHWQNFRYIFRSLFRQTPLLRLILFNLSFYSTATLVAVWGFQRYWQEIDIPLSWFGYLWALSNLTVALVGRWAHSIEKALGSVRALIVLGALPVIGYLGMGVVGSFWGVLFCLCLQASRGLNHVILHDALNRRISADMRASANSVSSLLFRLIFIGLGPLAGHLMDRHGLSVAFYSLAALYALVFSLFLLPLIGQRNNFFHVDE